MLKLFQTTFLFNFNGETYRLNQNPDTDVTIDDPRKIEGKLGSDGTGVYYTTGQGEPITITASGIGMGVDLFLSFSGEGGVFDKNKEGLDLFSLTIFGKDHQNKNFEMKYTQCAFAERPRQTAIGQGVPEVSFIILSFVENMRTF